MSTALPPLDLSGAIQNSRYTLAWSQQLTTARPQLSDSLGGQNAHLYLSNESACELEIDRPNGQSFWLPSGARELLEVQYGETSLSLRVDQVIGAANSNAQGKLYATYYHEYEPAPNSIESGNGPISIGSLQFSALPILMTASGIVNGPAAQWTNVPGVTATAPLAGRYLVWMHVSFVKGTTMAGGLRVNIAVNGTNQGRSSTLFNMPVNTWVADSFLWSLAGVPAGATFQATCNVDTSGDSLQNLDCLLLYLGNF